jgi:hypothetical protein
MYHVYHIYSINDYRSFFQIHVLLSLPSQFLIFSIHVSVWYMCLFQRNIMQMLTSVSFLFPLFRYPVFQVFEWRLSVSKKKINSTFFYIY